MLLFFAVLGYLLALPVLIPAVMKGQAPPQHTTPGQVAVLVAVSYAVALLLDWQAGRRRKVAPWVVPARAAVLTGVSALIAWLVGAYLVPRIFGGQQDLAAGNAVALQCVAVGAIAWAWRLRVQSWAGWPPERQWTPPRAAARGGTRTATVTRPGPGEVWVAMVPFRDRAEAARHYCVVVGVQAGYAEVLQITSKDKGHRDDYIRMENEGWDRTGKPSWIEVGMRPRRVPYESFLADHPQGPCPPRVWQEIQRRQNALGAPRPPRPRPAARPGPTAGGPRRPPSPKRQA
ncbi:hypothetical protein [Kitasatospora sp. NPDC093806]|uniref:hypothetical protein n=1 Tax=Kitasatospora sp. NPDC093806 TaxID=3155075 RepID=UPI003426F66F